MLTGAVWYPCAAPQQETKIGGRVITGPKACPTAGEKLPFIVLSHGRTAWFGAHHDTAVALADAGFVVAAINHPGDNSFDHSQTDDLSVFVERPVDIKRLVDFMLGAWSDAAKIDHERIDSSASLWAAIRVLLLSEAIPTSARVYPAAKDQATEHANSSETMRFRPSRLSMTCVSKPLSSSIRASDFSFRQAIWQN